MDCAAIRRLPAALFRCFPFVIASSIVEKIPGQTGKDTKIAQGQQNPQKAIIEWIFRRTGTADWHGEKIAVLCASKTQVRAYNSPEILKQVGEVVERFTNATDDILAVHVRFFVSSDTRWRYSVFSQLTPVGNGPQGQQIWTLRLSSRRCSFSRESASWPMSGWRWSTARF